MVLIGGEVSTLLLGFALVCAIGLRRGLAAERRRLLERGARRPQLWLAVGAEVSAMSVLGALVGVAAGAGIVAVVAARAGLPDAAVLGHSLGSPLGVALVLVAWLAGTAAVLAAARARETTRSGLRLLDVAALGAVVTVGVGLARGGLNADTLAAGGDATLLLLLPGLVSFVAAVAAGRLIGPLMRAVERAARQGPGALRLALLALARAPSRTIATAAFLIVSLGLALFAASYRATLERSARDEAAFAVPLDYAVSEGSQLVLPVAAAPLSRYRRLGTPYPVLRLSGTVAGPGTSVLSPTVLGVPAAALTHLHWRSDFSHLPPAELASRLGADGPARLRGVRVTAPDVSLPVRVRGTPVRLDLAVADSHGRIRIVPLGERGAGVWTLAALLPRGTRELVGLELSLASAQRFGYFHREAEVGATGAPAGTLELGPLRAGAHTLTHWRGWVARGGARLAHRRVTYSFTQGQTILLRLPQPTDGHALRVVVSPEIASAAGPNGSITLDLQDQQLPARIVGVAARFPDADQQDEGFVIADESRLATALDARLPGTGTPGEIWLSGPPQAEQTLRRAPFAVLDVASRRAIERSLAGDPLARGMELTLGSNRDRAAAAPLRAGLGGGGGRHRRTRRRGGADRRADGEARLPRRLAGARHLEPRMIEVRDAFRIFESAAGGTVALQGLNLTVEPGEIVVVLGPSGSGKTTLLRVLSGLERLSAGGGNVLGTQLRDIDDAFRARNLGLLDQHYARSLSADLACRQTVALQLELLGHDPRQAGRAADDLLEQVGLADRADDRPGSLSGGEQQRVAVCAAVAHRPGLLLADEPAGELDSDNAATVYRLLDELVRGSGATALIVSHDAHAASIADRLVYVRDGRVVAQARPGHGPAFAVTHGWVRLPDAVLAQTGHPSLVMVEAAGGRLVLEPIDGTPAAALTQTAAAAPGPVVAAVEAVEKRYGRRIVLDGP